MIIKVTGFIWFQRSALRGCHRGVGAAGRRRVGFGAMLASSDEEVDDGSNKNEKQSVGTASAANSRGSGHVAAKTYCGRGFWQVACCPDPDPRNRFQRHKLYI